MHPKTKTKTKAKPKTKTDFLPPVIPSLEGAKKSNPMMKQLMKGVDKAEAQSAKVPELIKSLLADGPSKDFFIPKQIWIYV